MRVKSPLRFLILIVSFLVFLATLPGVAQTTVNGLAANAESRAVGVAEVVSGGHGN
jgi:hypothetical protein